MTDVALFNSAAPSVQQVRALQREMQAGPTIDLPVSHHFTDGAYVRELRMPAGTALVGKMHRTAHALVVTGDVTIINGGRRERITGTRVLQTKPGTKRAIYAHADSVLITLHVTSLTDVDQIERAIIVPEHEELGFTRQIEGETA